MSNNWYINAIKNGIGGTNLGGDMGIAPLPSAKSISLELEIFTWLTSSQNVDKALKDGYIKAVGKFTPSALHEIDEHNKRVKKIKKDFMPKYQKHCKLFLINNNKKPVSDITGSIRNKAERLLSEMDQLIDSTFDSLSYQRKNAINTFRKAKRELKELPKTQRKGQTQYALTDLGKKEYKTMFELGSPITYSSSGRRGASIKERSKEGRRKDFIESVLSEFPKTKTPQNNNITL